MNTLTIVIILLVIVVALIAYRINAIAADAYGRYRRGEPTKKQEKELKAFRRRLKKENEYLNKRQTKDENKEDSTNLKP